MATETKTLYDSLSATQKMGFLLRWQELGVSPERKRRLKDLIPELIEKYSTCSTLPHAREERIVSQLQELENYHVIDHAEFCKLSGFPPE